MNSKVTILGKRGDLSAKPGSEDWAIAARLEMQALIRDNQSSAEHLDWWLKAMNEHAGYRQLYDGQGQAFASFESFCIAKAPYGLGYSLPVLNGIVKERKSAQQQAHEPDGKTINAGPGPLTAEEKSNGDIVTINPTGKGNKATYLTRRIARDHPAILERMKAGEYKSVRAAALEAGIVKPVMTVPLDAARAAPLLAKHFTLAELAEHWPL